MSESPNRIVVISFPPDLLDFVDRARGGDTRASFARVAMAAAAAQKLGEVAPKADVSRGRTSKVKAAAEAAGLTVAQYMRKCAVEAAGGEYHAPAPKALAVAAE